MAINTSSLAIIGTGMLCKYKVQVFASKNLTARQTTSVYTYEAKLKTEWTRLSF